MDTIAIDLNARVSKSALAKLHDLIDWSAFQSLIYANKLKIPGFGARYFGSFYAWQNHRKCRRHSLDFATQKSLESSLLQNKVSSGSTGIELTSCLDL